MSLDNDIDAWLSEIRPIAVKEMQAILAVPQPEDTALLDFEFHGDGLSRCKLSIMMFPMDGTAGQLGNRPFGMGQLPAVPQKLAADSGLWDVIDDKLFPWFADCWHEAGGTASGLRAYIFQHDDDRSFDLNAKKWIDDEEKWDE